MAFSIRGHNPSMAWIVRTYERIAFSWKLDVNPIWLSQVSGMDGTHQHIGKANEVLGRNDPNNLGKRQPVKWTIWIIRCFALTILPKSLLGCNCLHPFRNHV